MPDTIQPTQPGLSPLEQWCKDYKRNDPPEGSFPVALSPRALSRYRDEYAYRAALLPSSPL